MFIPIVIAISALYHLFMVVIIETKNIRSAVLFKFVPAVLCAGLAYAALVEFGIILVAP